jgi:hypothetical protein
MGYALMGRCWALSGGKEKKKKKSILSLSIITKEATKKTITKERKRSLCNITIVIFCVTT